MGANFPLALPIDLVSNENEGEFLGIVRASIFYESILPLIECLKRLRVGKIEAESAAIGTSVKGKAERLEFFLSCGIPNLQCYDLTVDLNLLLGEIGSDGGLGVHIGFVVDILLKECGLSYSGVTQDDDLEEISLL